MAYPGSGRGSRRCWRGRSLSRERRSDFLLEGFVELVLETRELNRSLVRVPVRPDREQCRLATPCLQTGRATFAQGAGALAELAPAISSGYWDDVDWRMLAWTSISSPSPGLSGAIERSRSTAELIDVVFPRP